MRGVRRPAWMALAKCSQTQEWLVYAKAWQHDYEGSSE